MNKNIFSKLFGDEKRALVVIFIIAVLLRMGGVYREKLLHDYPLRITGHDFYYLLMNDSFWYVITAKGILETKQYAIMNLPWHDFSATIKDGRPWDQTHGDFKYLPGGYIAHKFVPPLYPLFLAACIKIGGPDTLSYFIPQLIIAGLSCVFVFFLGKRFFGSKIGLIAALAMALYPDLILWTHQIRTETLYIFLLLAGFLALLKGNERGSIPLISLSAFIFGLATLTRMTFIAFLPFIFGWEIIFFSSDKKRGLLAACLFGLIFVIILLPWSYYNYKIFDKFTPLTDEGSDAFFNFENNKCDNAEEFNSYMNSQDNLSAKIFRYVKTHPVRYALATSKRLLVFWGPFRSPNRLFAKIYKTIQWIIVMPLAFAGIFLSVKLWKKTGIILLFILYYSMVHVSIGIESGLVSRYPIQPFLCIFFAYGLSKLFLKNKEEHLISAN
ncbi:MAG: glycosyltransferase family 39 protein [Elusimicrobiota bacterium]